MTVASVTPIAANAAPCCASLLRGQLRLGLQTVIPFVATDAECAHLMGVLLEVDENGLLTLVSTDGHVLSKFTIATAVTGTKTARAVLGSNDVKTAIKALACNADEATKSVELTIADSTIRIEILNARHSFDTLKLGEYPPYQAVIPKDERVGDGTSLIRVNPDFIARAGKAAALMKRSMEVSFGDTELDPIVCKVDAHEEGNFTVVIMPMRA